MLDVFSSVRGLMKVESLHTDNIVCKLHYRVTVLVLLCSSLVVTSRQYIGDPMNCMMGDLPSYIVDTYCWMYSTYTLRMRLGDRIGVDVAQPGVSSQAEDNGPEVYHKYYQWVCFVLFFQATCFYFPRYLWKMWEASRLKMLVQDLNCPIISDDNRKDRIRLLLNYFQDNLHCQNYYVNRFIICELLNLANVVVQIYLVDYFLDGEFSTYGWDVLKFLQLKPEDRIDPMARVFPKVAKCTFYDYGPTGSIQKHDGLCLLPINIVNEKIYVFLWFWFVFLTIVTGLCIIYRAAIVMSPTLRLYLLRTRSRSSSRKDVQIVAQNFQLGDWFMFYQLSKNIDPVSFKELMSSLAIKLNVKV